ncbi:MAG TPA: SusC/RagA family TonB-linked outer membrane protein [Longimicrobium sp.]|nr:SusC/RagA family TonB-linked outer membrane protein [Longimicrobium sp.]
MRRRTIVSLLAALFASGPLYAQTGQVTGTVTSSEGGRPLSGATVAVVGASQRAVTGPDGRYTLAGVAAGTRRLSANTIGHATSSADVNVGSGQTATHNFVLQPLAVALQGVVAVGYGERRVRDVTGSVQAVSADQFNTGRVVSPEQLIQGKVAGVQVITSGEPGGGTRIRIRGGTSVNASNDPLFVIDGVPLEAGGGLSSGRNPLNFINPNDIERVTVLKDASSTAIYGSRGANGVIIVETRTGSSRGPQFTYSTTASTSRITRQPDMLSTAEFRAAMQQHQPGRVAMLGTANTNWRGAVERNGVGQEHQLAFSGAGQASNYRISLGYLDQQGVVRGSETKRASLAFNYNQRLFSDRLNLRASARGSRAEDQYTPGSVLGSATVFDPTQPIRTATGEFWEQLTFNPGQALNNPVAELLQVVDNGRTYRSLGNLEARYRFPFLEGLSGTARLGYDVAKSERRGFLPSTLQAQLENPVACDPAPAPCVPAAQRTGTVSRSTPGETTGLLDAFLTYTRHLGAANSDVDATAGYSYQDTNGDYPSFYARGLTSDALGVNGVPTALVNVPTIYTRESKLISFFGRANYTLADKYLATVSVRRDGSSRFGPANHWGTFPAVALGWRVSEEPWLRGVGWLSDLKVRGSWGINGNQAIRDYLWISSYDYSDRFAQVQFGNTFVTTIRPTAVDTTIRWEQTKSSNVGFDYGLFDDRITGSVDYYVKNTSDLLFTIPVPAGTNLSNYVTTNIGSMQNRGLELSVNGRVLDGGPHRLSWNANFNASTNRNRLTSINAAASSAQQILVGGIAGGVGGNIQILRPGVPVNAFYVFEHRRDANGKPISDVKGGVQLPDTAIYVDRNGDHQITDDDKRPFHSPTPRWILAHSSQFGFRNLDLGFTLRAYLGNYVYNNTASANGWYDELNQAAGPINLHRSVLKTGFVRSQFYSDFYVEDASFLRMDNITLGYTLPRTRAFQSIRVSGTVQNAFTVTGYSGVDPEAFAQTPTGPLFGIDNVVYPRSRTFSLGVTLGF